MQQILGGLAVQWRVAQVDQHQVDVGSAADDRDAGLGDIVTEQSFGEDPGT
ncbi:hypothetical protein NIIDMKKI_13560 [Mycobacterium kansasii]|uniref:Uncharacterized protein n=1 Tax=Mycobacterium kansasii TaxID=1768 RepID=A0A7G1I576_MYCKA|nr:hypothetical protein NIIDMKKI_13560 [Mycobacterium kansasii]